MLELLPVELHPVTQSLKRGMPRFIPQQHSFIAISFWLATYNGEFNERISRVK